MQLPALRSSFLLAALLAGSLAGCGGAPVATRSVPLARHLAGSWMDPSAKTKPLLYLSDESGLVYVYAYPSLAPMGTLAGMTTPAGLCTDRKGDVWVTDTIRSQVVEFAHGGTVPIRTLQDGEGYLYACAVNPRNGDLAIANNTIGGDDAGNVTIFSHGFGKATAYSDRHVRFVDFLGYDPRGDLLVDGYAAYRRSPWLDELAAGGKKLKHIAWHGPRINHPGGVQWDGSSWAIGTTSGVIYQTANGAVKGKTTLEDACYADQFFIDGSRVIASSLCNSVGVFHIYKYPDGGAPLKTIAGFTYPYGAVISR